MCTHVHVQCGAATSQLSVHFLGPLARLLALKLGIVADRPKKFGRYKRFLIDSDLRWQLSTCNKALFHPSIGTKNFGDEREGSERDKGHSLWEG